MSTTISGGARDFGDVTTFIEYGVPYRHYSTLGILIQSYTRYSFDGRSVNLHESGGQNYVYLLSDSQSNKNQFFDVTSVPVLAAISHSTANFSTPYVASQNPAITAWINSKYEYRTPSQLRIKSSVDFSILFKSTYSFFEDEPVGTNNYKYAGTGSYIIGIGSASNAIIVETVENTHGSNLEIGLIGSTLVKAMTRELSALAHVTTLQLSASGKSTNQLLVNENYVKETTIDKVLGVDVATVIAAIGAIIDSEV